MKQHKKQNGFSIPEVIIAIALVALIIVTAGNLLVSSNRGNVSNINQIIAYNLAQEALEGMRNIRDGYWLHNQDWRGDKNIFGEDFQDDGYYVIRKQTNRQVINETNQLAANLDALNTFETVQQYAPWKLEKILNPTDQRTRLYKVEKSDFIMYAHDSQGRVTPYKRWIEVETKEYETAKGETLDTVRIVVTAVVEWEEQSRTKSVRIPLILTDWKSEPN